MRTHHDRPGFSLIELLVVISIIGILTSLTLSAVQSSRQAAQAMTCSDHLRQIGIGLSLHHNTHGVFPSNGGWDGRQTITAVDGRQVEVFTRTNADGVVYHWGVGDPSLPPERQTGGWPYAILPYIEQRNLYDQVNFSVALALYHCPSRRDPSPQAPVDDSNASYSGGGWSWGKIDYAVNGLIIRNRPGTTHPLDRPASGLNPLSGGLARIARITDGTSNTILAGEKAMDPDRYDTGGWYWDEPFLLGGSYASARRGIDVLPDLPGIYYNDNWGSAHPSGVHFGFADGSVRMLRHGSPPTLMRALMTPNGREVAPET